MPRFLDALARLMPRRTMTLAETKASRTGPLVAIGMLGRPVWVPRDYAAFAREGFMQNAIVYRAVRMVAEAAASVPLLLYEGGVEHEDHPLLDLLGKPSPDQTGTDFLEAWYGYLLVSGNAYAEAVAIGGEVRELFALRPDRMKVIPGAQGWPEAYEYTAGGETVRFAEEPVAGVRPILHVRLFHPANDHYGMSPIEAAATAIDIHNSASAWNKALLDNSARPSGALVYAASEGRMTAEQFERLKGELETSYTGARQAGRPLLLEGGLDWKPLSLSPKDMDFIEAKNTAAREIALALGVPPMLLGIPGDNTYSNYQEAQRAFWRQTVLPLVNRTAKALSLWLAPAFAPGGRLREAESPGASNRAPGAAGRVGALELRPDLDQIEALAPEREALWVRLERTTFLTANEKRAAVGYEPLDEPSPPGSDPAGLTPRAGLTLGSDLQGQTPLRKYFPSQPRVPRGNTDGGQWTDGGGGSGPSRANGDEGRVLSDANPDDMWKPGAQLAADDGRGGYPVDILEEETRGGHTFERHVNKPKEYLIARILNNRVNIPRIFGAGEKRAGSFTSVEAANKLVNSTLSDAVNIVEIEAFLQGGLLHILPVLYVHKDFAAPTGYEAYGPGDSKPEIRTTYGVTVRLQRDPRYANGYYVHSAWPTNRD